MVGLVFSRVGQKWAFIVPTVAGQNPEPLSRPPAPESCCRAVIVNSSRQNGIFVGHDPFLAVGVWNGYTGNLGGFLSLWPSEVAFSKARG